MNILITVIFLVGVVTAAPRGYYHSPSFPTEENGVQSNEIHAHKTFSSISQNNGIMSSPETGNYNSASSTTPQTRDESHLDTFHKEIKTTFFRDYVQSSAVTPEASAAFLSIPEDNILSEMGFLAGTTPLSHSRFSELNSNSIYGFSTTMSTSKPSSVSSATRGDPDSSTHTIQNFRRTSAVSPLLGNAVDEIPGIANARFLPAAVPDPLGHLKYRLLSGAETHEVANHEHQNIKAKICKDGEILRADGTCQVPAVGADSEFVTSPKQKKALYILKNQSNQSQWGVEVPAPKTKDPKSFIDKDVPNEPKRVLGEKELQTTLRPSAEAEEDAVISVVIRDTSDIVVDNVNSANDNTVDEKIHFDNSDSLKDFDLLDNSFDNSQEEDISVSYISNEKDNVQDINQAQSVSSKTVRKDVSSSYDNVEKIADFPAIREMTNDINSSEERGNGSDASKSEKNEFAEIKESGDITRKNVNTDLSIEEITEFVNRVDSHSK